METGIFFDTRVYNAQFSNDGEMIFCSSQNEIRVYDTSDLMSWRLMHMFEGRNIRWTITDVDLSLSQQYLLYTTITSSINLISLRDQSTLDSAYSGKINLEPSACRTFDIYPEAGDFGVYSAKLSADATEVVAGSTLESIEVYDLVRQKTAFRVSQAHSNDINSVCFANKENSQVIFTGSDDSTIRIWDRRTLGRKNIPEGVLLGHREGVTHVSSKGDGFTLISNGKDQALKLWDIRNMMNFPSYSEYIKTHHYQTNYDYRWWRYPLQNYTKRLSEDRSLLTFRGHTVLSTLIRCSFSPVISTNQRFLVTGSADGRVYIYDSVTGKKVNILEPDVEEIENGIGPFPIVRDVSWHPVLPVISATGFDGSINYYFSA
jgi:WD repeat-containing protein 23